MNDISIDLNYNGTRGRNRDTLDASTLRWAYKEAQTSLPLVESVVVLEYNSKSLVRVSILATLMRRSTDPEEEVKDPKEDCREQAQIQTHLHHDVSVRLKIVQHTLLYYRLEK